MTAIALELTWNVDVWDCVWWPMILLMTQPLCMIARALSTMMSWVMFCIIIPTTIMISKPIVYTYQLVSPLVSKHSSKPRRKALKLDTRRRYSRRLYCRRKHGPIIMIKGKKPTIPPTIYSCQSSFANYKAPTNAVPFDTNSFRIGIDGHSSYSITNSPHDFIGPTKRVKVRIKGISGGTMSTLRGTVRWTITDDDGVPHSMEIPNTYYVADAPLRLLSPQHLAQVHRQAGYDHHGTSCVIHEDAAILTWHNSTYCRTVSLNAANVPVMWSAASYQAAQQADFEFHHDDSSTGCVFQTHIIPPDDNEDELPCQPSEPGIEQTSNATTTLPSTEHPSLTSTEHPSTTTFEHPSTEHPSTAHEHPSNEHSSANRSLSTEHLSEHSSADYHSVNEGARNLLNFEEDEREKQVSEVPIDEGAEVRIRNPTQHMLYLHTRMGHLPFSRLQEMARCGYIDKRLADCKVPHCAACKIAKATKVPWKTSKKQGTIKPAERPGQCVSVDQMESSTPGLIAQLKGKPTKARYRYATVFVDHFSDFTYVFLMRTLSSEETIMAKEAFEAFSREQGVTIEQYHADNGRFADNAFIEHTKKNHQRLTFCGVDAHFQNGRAEKKIRDLQDSARTSLIYAKNRWKGAITSALWPYAVRHANDCQNASVRRGAAKSPNELFAGMSAKPKYQFVHSFGCPAYVWSHRKQNGESMKKWMARARVGIYLGQSPAHARSVALVLSLDTGLVSPQYHVRYDDLFETTQTAEIPISKWQQKCHFIKGVARSEEKLDNTAGSTRTHVANQTAPVDCQDIPAIDQDSMNNEEDQPITPELQTENETLGNGSTEEDSDAVREPLTDVEPNNEVPREDNPASETRKTRSGRTVRTPVRYANSAVAFATEFDPLQPLLYQETDQLRELDDPIAYSMKATSDPDTMYYHEAMKEKDRPQFLQAMKDEFETHIKRKHFKVIRKSDVPEGEVILPAVWAMKRKRRIISRMIYKWKARLNLGGHKMIKGKHFDQTYAPSLGWPTIRLLLTLSIINNWKTRQIDFVLAYPQAKAQRTYYMELPKGIRIPGCKRSTHCLKVTANLYGAKDASRTWFMHLTKGLNDIGFQQSKEDECVFYRGTTIFVVYTDDGIILDKDGKKIEKAMSDMKKKFTISDEGNLQEYLGVRVDHRSDGTIKLSQPQLIDSILKDLGLIYQSGEGKQRSTPKDTPAQSTTVLGPDLEGEPFDYDWDYRSVVGKLNFLEKSTRAELAFAVHQCARFTSNPKRSHGEAVKRIGRYLLKTRNEGMIIKPDTNASFDCYVDADFCGNWDKETAPTDPDTARSRGGFIVKYAGCPIYWSSKIIAMICLSTTESEYHALSTAARYVKGTMYLLEEMQQKGFQVQTIPNVHCRIFEDNSAALEMARVPKMRPRTRHLNCMLHHFRGEVANKRLIPTGIGTKDQQADILTKALDTVTFERLRKMILGW